MAKVGEWIIQTRWSRERAEEFLRSHQPWRMNVKFSNGAQAFDFAKAEPANGYPLRKLTNVRKAIPAEAFKGPVLDVGHNLGYNSMDIAQHDGSQVVGIDFNPRHQEIAEQLVEAAGLDVDVTFRKADAQTYVEPGRFSLVLHLGTLYHLPNPVQALQTAAKNLRSGGWLALETTAYTGPHADERHLNKWIHGLRGDPTNYWALSKATIAKVLELAGMTRPEPVREVHLPIHEGELSRVLYTACKG